MDGRIKNRIIKTKILRDSIFLRMILILMLFFACPVFSAEKPDIRELDAEFLDINEFNQSKESMYKAEDIKKIREENEVIEAPVLKGGISEIKAIVGKSQILKFDNPIKRVSITKPELVDMIFLTPKELIMNGKEGGETTVIIWGEEGEPVFFNLFVENNNINFIKEVKKVTPNENITIDFVASGNDSALKVVLKGKLSSTLIKEKIDKIAAAYGYTIIDLTETLTPQVMLEVKIVEMKKTKNKNKNMEMKQGVFNYVDFTEQISGTDWVVETLTETIGAGLTDDPIISEVLKAFDKKDLRASSFNSAGFDYWKSIPSKELAYTLNYAETEGLIKILAEPRVMVVHGQQASFNSGDQVPVQSGVDQLGNKIYTYRDVGININISPQILEESSRILLDITAEVSEISTASGNDDTPGISSRKGTTKVEVANNETTVITGLVRKVETKNTTKFPFLSNLPYVGKWFDSVTSSNADTELMFFVTPTIIKPDMANEGL